MADPDKAGAAAGAWTRVRDWFNGGDPDGPAKIRQWARGYDSRPEGYTYGMMGPAMILSVVAAVLYPLTQGYGSIVALVVAIVLVLRRHMIERRVARDVSDLVQAQEQFSRTRNADYLEFVHLKSESLLEDNKMLTPPTRRWLEERAQWAREQRERAAERAGRKSEHGRGGRRKRSRS